MDMDLCCDEFMAEVMIDPPCVEIAAWFDEFKINNEMDMHGFVL